MSFTLPDLPYAHDALQPFMSKETLEFHHDKHHLAYVTNGNNAIKGTEFEGKSLEEIVKASHGKNPAVFNNAGQHYNHLHFWKWMKPNGGGKIPGALEKAIVDSSARSTSSRKTSSPPASASSARAGPGSRSRAASSPSARPRMARARWSMAHPDPRRRRLGALLLHRLPQPSPRLSQGLPREPGELGLRRRALRRRQGLIGLPFDKRI
jgi:hypothetical protein